MRAPTNTALALFHLSCVLLSASPLSNRSPAIYPKMSPLAYVQSCHRCLPLACVSHAMLLDMYEDVAARPLQIAPSTTGESAHSFYSAEGEAASTSGGAADPTANAAGSNATAGWGAWAEGQAVATPAARAHGSAAPLPREIVIDWSVAYWNLVDAARYVRSAAWLFASRKVNRVIDFVMLTVGFWVLLPLAVVGAGVLVMLRPPAAALTAA